MNNGEGAAANTRADSRIVVDAASKPLQSLTPSYDERQHGTYLRRLEQAITDPENLNIAVTGRYGSGKSSVLDQFQSNHAGSTLRLAISTLAPGEEGETTTNRIQKEIVKQLLYGASRRVGRNSRFRKIAVLSKTRAVTESVFVVAVLGTLLQLLGWLPVIKGTGPEHGVPARAAAWVATGVLATLALSVVRTVTSGRFLSDVSAGGASVSLAKDPDTFFDKYLDEIVHYFSRECRDIVIFEDLDRFEDPHIFETLRELNVLLNETPERRAKQRPTLSGRGLRWMLSKLPDAKAAAFRGKLPARWTTRALGEATPLRFIYAVKDSVFDKIDTATARVIRASDSADTAPTQGPGTDAPRAQNANTATPPAAKVGDAAAAETRRANRTKFFDIVIPLVPFISHRSARDLLVEQMEKRDITGIDRRVVNTVAQHCTDMRLLRNVCNEYLIFVERLLDSDDIAPGLNQSRLFALIAYKNFHLEDFEQITRRESCLDRLYDLHLRLVRDSIAAAELRKRDLLAEGERERLHDRDAQTLNRRLTLYAEAVNIQQTANGYGFPFFRIGRTRYQPEETGTWSFWSAVAQAKSLTVGASNLRAGGAEINVRVFDQGEVSVMFPEALDADQWERQDEAAAGEDLRTLEADVAQLRRADFKELAQLPKFTLNAPLSDDALHSAHGLTFNEILAETVTSELARDLVRRGYIDRNFSLYASQFYGNFTGVDVANYMVQHVQTNTVNINYDLSRDNAVDNLLAEADDAGEELLSSVTAYNIDIVNHLLTNDDSRVDEIIAHLLTSGPDDTASAFLSAFFTREHAQRTKLAARLSANQWREVFTYLATSDDVPADARSQLVSAALLHFDVNTSYELGEEVRDFVTSHYGDMVAITGWNSPAARDRSGATSHADRVSAALAAAGVVIPDLSPLDAELRDLVIAADGYVLTADNLRAAVDVTGDVSLEHIAHNRSVYARCLRDMPSFLTAVNADPRTSRPVTTADALTHALWDLLISDSNNESVSDSPSSYADRSVQTNDNEEPVYDDTEAVATFIAASAPDATLRSLVEAPRQAWPLLAKAHRFRCSLANIELYRTTIGSVDAHLAGLLEKARTIVVDEPDDTKTPDGEQWDRQAAALALLNATELHPATRVGLAASVGPTTPLPVEDIVAESTNLFALLIGDRLVADEVATFRHLHAGGPAAVLSAIAASTQFRRFLTPELVQGAVAEVLSDQLSSAKVGAVIVSDLSAYVPDDDVDALAAAGHYADTTHISLAPDAVARIARVIDDHGVHDDVLMVRLLAAADPAPTEDQVIETFQRLGGPYRAIGTEKLNFPDDAAHKKLLAILHSARRISKRADRRKAILRTGPPR